MEGRRRFERNEKVRQSVWRQFRSGVTGEAAEQYDVYYRVHAQDYGWLGWTKNGENAGTSGKSK